jgi:two-component system response regulator FixJ
MIAMSETADHPQPVIHVVEDDAVASAMVRNVAERQGLKVAQYASAESFLAALKPEQPGCLVTDIHLGGGMSGMDLQAELRRRDIYLPIIMITAQPEVPMAVQAMHNQAVDFLVKPIDADKLGERLKQALDLDRRQRLSAAERAAAQSRLSRLTPREREVMGCVVQGMANKQIASHLHLSEKTVEVHRGNVMRKTGADNVPELVRLTLASGQSDVQAR